MRGFIANFICQQESQLELAWAGISTHMHTVPLTRDNLHDQAVWSCTESEPSTTLPVTPVEYIVVLGRPEPWSQKP